MLPIFVKIDDVRSGRKAKTCHGWLLLACESMGYVKEKCNEDFDVLGQFCAKIITLRLQ